MGVFCAYLLNYVQLQPGEVSTAELPTPSKLIKRRAQKPSERRWVQQPRVVIDIEQRGKDRSEPERVRTET